MIETKESSRLDEPGNRPYGYNSDGWLIQQNTRNAFFGLTEGKLYTLWDLNQMKKILLTVVGSTSDIFQIGGISSWCIIRGGCCIGKNAFEGKVQLGQAWVNNSLQYDNPEKEAEPSR
jgi:hypothetical protein